MSPARRRWCSSGKAKLSELQHYLNDARRQAVGDDKAIGWIRLAQPSHEQYALIARMFHEAQKFPGKGPKPASKAILRDRAEAYYAWVHKTVRLNETDPDFKKNFFVDDCAIEGAIWSDPELLKTNFRRMPSVWFK